MLQQISWREYFIWLGLGTVVYYVWWLVRFFPGLSSGRPGEASLKEGKRTRVQPARPDAAEIEDVPSTVTNAPAVSTAADLEPAKTTQPIIMPQPQRALPAPLPSQSPVFLSQLAGDLALAIKHLVERQSSAEAPDAEFMDRLKRLLTTDPFKKLRSTHYEEKINALLLREWERYGSVPGDPAVITGLWQD